MTVLIILCGMSQLWLCMRSYLQIYETYSLRNLTREYFYILQKSSALLGQKDGPFGLFLHVSDLTFVEIHTTSASIKNAK